MADRTRNLRERVAGALELPGDVALDVPRLTLIGNLQVAIDNHRGLIEYSRDRVRVGMNTGQLIVTGTDLTISFVHDEDLLVTGKLKSIEFADGE
ncbi:MAG: sporulation protein YqfC [Chloroflexota bacterium]